MRIFHLDETQSTNIDARSGCAWDVYVAEFQHAGRGRLDHNWHSAKGENLTFSVVLPGVGRAMTDVATLPLVVGLAVVRAVKSIIESSACPVRLKWPNDVVVGVQKLAGILCERRDDDVVAGIGLNVNQTAFPAEIAERATSLACLAAHSFVRDDVLTAVLSELETAHAQWVRGGFAALHAELAAFDFLKGREVSVRQTDCDAAPVMGRCGGIAPDGALIVAGRPVYAGEAHVCAFTV